jgi:GT2 family glycosyltransferase
MCNNYDDINIKLIIAVNDSEEYLTSFIKKFETNFNTIHGDDSCTVMWLDENIGKGKALNKAVKTYAPEFNPDYICSMDSDIIHIDNNWLHKSLKTFTDYKIHYRNKPKIKPLALVSPNMLEDAVSFNNHLIDRLEGYHIKVRSWSCWTTHNNAGIAGPCFIVDYEAWKKIGGYYDALYIGGNDAYMLNDLFRTGYQAIVNKDVYFIHPKHTKEEEQYTKWKLNMISKSNTRPQKLPSDVAAYDGKRNF